MISSSYIKIWVMSVLSRENGIAEALRNYISVINRAWKPNEVKTLNQLPWRKRDHCSYLWLIEFWQTAFNERQPNCSHTVAKISWQGWEFSCWLLLFMPKLAMYLYALLPYMCRSQLSSETYRALRMVVILSEAQLLWAAVSSDGSARCYQRSSAWADAKCTGCPTSGLPLQKSRKNLTDWGPAQHLL